MSNIQPFRPNWASSPGDTIMDILNERQIPKTEFEELTNLSTSDADDLLNGRATITISLARRITTVLGASVSFWMSRDFQYRQDAKRLAEVSSIEWIRELPLSDMIKFGWITPPPSPSDELSTCLEFFGMSGLSQWNDYYRSSQATSAFRTSPSFDSQPASVAAWLRQGELEANELSCAPWNSRRFEGALRNIRSLTRQRDPTRFLPSLREICSAAGVAVVVVRCPSGCRASGATRFISARKALLQLSFRYLTDDHFWFTFFHEAAHLLLHQSPASTTETPDPVGKWILEGLDQSQSADEDSANEFASRLLIPDSLQTELSTIPLTPRSIIRFAHDAGIAPGIVVGQLQHTRRLGFHRLNNLKRRFQWLD